MLSTVKSAFPPIGSLNLGEASTASGPQRLQATGANLRLKQVSEIGPHSGPYLAAAFENSSGSARYVYAEILLLQFRWRKNSPSVDNAKEEVLFYMCEEDEAAFHSFLEANYEFEILVQASAQEHETVSRFTDMWGNKYSGNCFLWNRKISPTPDYMFSEANGSVYGVNSIMSEVVGVRPSEIRAREISLGHLYVVGETVEVAPHLGIWFDEIENWFKRNMRHIHEGAFYSDGVAKLIESEYQLAEYHI